MITPADLTPDTLDLFKDLVRWAPDWSGQPMVEVTKSQRGNLTDLKVKGLIRTFDSDGCMFAVFLPAGFDLAEQLGMTELRGY